MTTSEARTMPSKKRPPAPPDRPGDGDLVKTTITFRWEQISRLKQAAAERQRDRGEGRADMSEVVRDAVDSFLGRPA
jgi:hypothetical protein